METEVNRKSKKTEINFDDVEILHLKRKIKNVCTVKAYGIQTVEGLVVLKGSRISPKSDNTISNNLKKIRTDAFESNKVNNEGILQEDMLFSSPTTAAKFVIGKSDNGLRVWKDKNEQPLQPRKSKMNN